MIQQHSEEKSVPTSLVGGMENETLDSLVKLYASDLIAFASDSIGKGKLSMEIRGLNNKSTLEDFQKACLEVGTLWRNACVNDETFQNKLRDQGVLLFCLQLLKDYFDRVDLWEEFDCRKTVLMLMQVLANAMTGNKPIQIHLYEILDGSFFKYILPKSVVMGRNFTNIACMCIYNSIAKGNLQIETEFFTNTQLMIDLLERLYETKHTKEWVFLIYKKYFLSKAYMTEESEDFFFASEETSRSMLEDIENSEDHILLNLLEIMDQFSNEQVQLQEPTPAADTYKHLIIFCLQIIDILREKFIPEGRSLGILTYRQFECIFVCLESLSNLSSLLILSSKKSSEIKLRTDCSSTMLTLLGLSCATKELKQEGSGICIDIFEQTGLLVFEPEEEEEEDEEKKGMYLGYKTLLIRTLANLTFKAKEIQDFIREQEGLPLVMSCCSIQENNPYLREWGVFCVRNLCEDNEANQQFITDMNLEGIDTKSEEILAKQGFKASVKNGKINLEKLDKGDGTETNESNSSKDANSYQTQ